MKIEEKGDQMVIVDFNELEAYKIACKIETDGINFYGQLVNTIENEAVKEKLEFLLQEEKKHLNFFADRLAAVSERQDDEFEEDSLLNYMDYGIFQPYQSIKDMADKIDDVKKALRLGIIVEEKSIKFYQACQAKISAAETKNEMQNIIEEEKRHRALFEKVFNELNEGDT